ncbi:MAG TPA: CPBP family intramembrane glutamic endopeptidase [Rhizomicrobium sp.]|nr:CPBP family intramembrane glutamic endopeptidase [Rhizomicrobium sp.]
MGERRTGFIHAEGTAFRAWPVLIAVLAIVGVPLLSQTIVDFAEHFTSLPERPQMPWIRDSYDHAAQFVLALAAIAMLKPATRIDHGLHLPPGKSYLGSAILWGLVLGALMALATYWPEIAARHIPADKPYPPDDFNIAGWFAYRGGVEPVSDEVLCRGLLVAWLGAMLPGRIVLGPYGVSAGGVIVAALFAMGWLFNFVIQPFGVALGEILCVFLMGLVYAYWFDRSRSLLAPIVGHGIAGAVQVAAVFGMVLLWQHPH